MAAIVSTMKKAGGPRDEWRSLMRRLLATGILASVAVIASEGPVAAFDFGAVYVDDAIYRVFGNAANVPDGTGTDPFAIFTNSTNIDQFGVAEFAPGSATGHHGGRWAIYRAAWTVSGNPSELVTSWSELQSYVLSGAVELVRDEAARFSLSGARGPGATRLTPGSDEKIS